MTPLGHWTPRVTKDLLLSKCRYFVTTQLWPSGTRIDPEGWLGNFLPAEEFHALHLLNSFFYFSHDLTTRLFVAAITNLSQNVISVKRGFVRSRGEWRTFIGLAHFVRVTGEKESDADSGYVFVRMARQELGVDESRIVRHPDILSRLLVDPGIPVIFVDDFVGSGYQFINLWHRQYEIAGGRTISFDILSRSLRYPLLYYCPLISTTAGLKNITDKCARVQVYPAHLIDTRYSALAPDSILWPEELRESGAAFIKKASQRAGIPDTNGGVNDWRGFHKLGLSISFAHCTPDATLPLFYWEENSWIPLVKRA
jgi:hypothetical protein